MSDGLEEGRTVMGLAELDVSNLPILITIVYH